MSTFLRLMISSVCVALFSVGTMPAQAQEYPVLAPDTWSSYTTIVYLRQSDAMENVDSYFMLEGVTCKDAREFRLDASAVAHRSMMKNALAALLGSREVRVKHSDCRVYELWVR